VRVVFVAVLIHVVGLVPKHCYSQYAVTMTAVFGVYAGSLSFRVSILKMLGAKVYDHLKS
jgi:hypothetical protein